MGLFLPLWGNRVSANPIVSKHHPFAFAGLQVNVQPGSNGGIMNRLGHGGGQQGSPLKLLGKCSHLDSQFA